MPPAYWAIAESDTAVSVLRDCVGDVIGRGTRFVRAGCVRLRHHGPIGVEAVVAGTEHYAVEIETAARGTAGSCTCHFAADGFLCKHMAATRLRWTAEDGRTPEKSNERPAPETIETDKISVGETDDEDDPLRSLLTQPQRERAVEELLGSTG